jgi:hypothetical protein
VRTDEEVGSTLVRARLEAAWLDRGFAEPAQVSATVLGDLKIDLAAGNDAEAVATRLVKLGIVT